MANRDMTPRISRVHALVTGDLDLSQNSAPTADMRQFIAPRLAEVTKALEVIQTSRDDAAYMPALNFAIWNEHRQLEPMRMLSTPAAATLDLFSRDPAVANPALGRISTRAGPGRRIALHPLFVGMVEREFTLWTVAVDDRFVTILFRVQSIPDRGTFPQFGNFQPWDVDHYFREVTDLAILDPFHDDPGNILGIGDVPTIERRQFIFDRLRRILREGSIMYNEDLRIHEFRVPLCGPLVTGYWCWGISREIIRRLRVVAHQRGRINPTGLTGMNNPPDLYADFGFDWTTYELRESLIGGVLLRARAMSNYQVFAGLLAPGRDSTYDHRMIHVRPDVGEINPDERITEFDTDGPSLIYTIPENVGGVDDNRDDTTDDDITDDGMGNGPIGAVNGFGAGQGPLVANVVVVPSPPANVFGPHTDTPSRLSRRANSTTSERLAKRRRL